MDQRRLHNAEEKLDDTGLVKRRELNTPLRLAASLGHVEVVKVLIERGADLGFDEETWHPTDKKPAVYFALMNGGSCEVLAYMLKHLRKCRTRAAKQRFSIDEPFADGETILHYAAELGVRREVFDLLMTYSPPIEARNSSGKTPLFVAACNERQDIIDWLLARGANIQTTQLLECRNCNGGSVLHHAIHHGASLSFVRFLLDKGVDVNMQNSSSRDRGLGVNRELAGQCFTALHIAAQLGRFEHAELLLSAGAKVDVVSKERCSIGFGEHPDSQLTPLHMVTRFPTDQDNATEFIYILLSHGANREARTLQGKTALHLATLITEDKLRHHVLGVLLHARSNINARDNTGLTPLHQASSYLCSNHYTRKSLDLLVKHGAEIEATTTDIGTQDNIFGIYFERDYGVTPFQVAIRRDRLATAILLRRHGAKMVFEPRRPPGPLYTTLKWRPDMSPLHLAVSSNPPDHDLIQYLLDQGADVNARDDLGRTPIFYALVDIHDDDGIRDMLFTAGADPAIQDNDGRTALYHAVDHPFEESNPFYIVDLLRAGAPLNVADNTGSTPLHIAAKHCDENVFYYLLDYGADVMVKDGKGDTPAHVAARQHAGFDAMMAFVEKGGRAVLEARNERQWTPVDLVRRSRNRVKRDKTDQIEWLLDYANAVEREREAEAGAEAGAEAESGADGEADGGADGVADGEAV